MFLARDVDEKLNAVEPRGTTQAASDSPEQHEFEQQTSTPTTRIASTLTPATAGVEGALEYTTTCYIHIRRVQIGSSPRSSAAKYIALADEPCR